MPRFDDEGRLVSDEYDDVYFAGDGVAETEHVFCAGNELAARFAAAKRVFVVAETGFGTGLNFLVVVDWFERFSPPSARLVFVSVDERVLDSRLLERVHERLGARFAVRARELRSRLAAADEARDRFEWRDDRFSLCVLRGDALEQLTRNDWRADAWLLDGFAPARNPA
ncbi:MAG: bifunctional tRNA (5-methylaminomethyl-2-thiouridine)(34)-methyltransferase MnmD/FAD-dependent 5-carboxymethylaminomethyl-2-thiouridine(34) oxidoreductase MnmC, partial [Planctomycetes bacterium]|nr:bifunctional tRNA (5-methylaminomethyl-2-thiouridine)(34)-methyltransferase MnmD/FAD-dependent 5-carboxymethylaminomethyl-2-thiouridine(34) oxidoreductase MnmC [Planctomycetota bacterium]